MKGKRPTILEVARKAGVGLGTVSRMAKPLERASTNPGPRTPYLP